MFNINHDIRRLSTGERFSWNYLKSSRVQAYLFKEFNDVNLEHDYIPLMGDELVEQILSFFYLGSQLIYPAKSYFVAVVYASIISFFSHSDDFWKALSREDLLIDDKYFKPYGKDFDTDCIYTGVIMALLDCMNRNHHNVDFLNRPESEIWRYFPSCSPTLEYFFEEFLFDDRDRACLKDHTFYDWEVNDV